MGNKKVRIIVSNYKQCSPDDFEKFHETIEIESNELYDFLKKSGRGKVEGAEIIRTT